MSPDSPKLNGNMNFLSWLGAILIVSACAGVGWVLALLYSIEAFKP
jgi:hypothetical protein